MWMPTVDHIGERCTWELELTVASSLVAVASGDLVEQVDLAIESTTRAILSFA